MKQNGIFGGALGGLRVWIVYGVIELLLAFVTQAFLQSDEIARPTVSFQGWQWRLVALVWGVYAASGLLLGGVLGGLFSWRKSRSAPLSAHLAALSLTIPFGANLVAARRIETPELISLGVTGLLTSALALSIFSEKWQRRTAVVTSPWVLSLLLLGSPWLIRDVVPGSSTVVKAAACLLLLLAILALGSIVRLVLLRYSGVRRKSAAVAAGIALMATFGLLLAQPGSTSGRDLTKPNIILITMDTVRADHLSVYGYKRDTTPYLRELAQTAAVYDRALAASDMTLPTHASIFTGMYPAWHGAHPAPPEHTYGRPLGLNRVTLAHLLRTAGYWTGGFVANYAFLNEKTGLAQGFAQWSTGIPAKLSSAERPFYLREAARRILSTATSTAEFDAAYLRGAEVTRRAERMMDTAQGAQKPFFLFLNYMDAHTPYVHSAEMQDRFPGRDPSFKPWADHERLTQSINNGRHQIQPAEQQHLLSQYDAGITAVDQAIANLIAEVKRRGLYENSLIVITSDHGEAFGEHGYMQHANGSVYQDQVHIPLLVKYPGAGKAERSHALASQVDLMPTILAAAGVPAPRDLQGRSLTSPRGDGDAVFAEARAMGQQQAEVPRFRGVRHAIFAGSSKVIAWSNGPEEAYDLSSDPNELQNRATEADPEQRRLSGQLKEWIASSPRLTQQIRKLDKPSLERLKSLGYTQ